VFCESPRAEVFLATNTSQGHRLRYSRSPTCTAGRGCKGSRSSNSELFSPGTSLPWVVCLPYHEFWKSCGGPSRPMVSVVFVDVASLTDSFSSRSLVVWPTLPRHWHITPPSPSSRTPSRLISTHCLISSDGSSVAPHLPFWMPERCASRIATWPTSPSQGAPVRCQPCGWPQNLALYTRYTHSRPFLILHLYNSLPRLSQHLSLPCHKNLFSQLKATEFFDIEVGLGRDRAISLPARIHMLNLLKVHIHYVLGFT
jgi:hypothetical protein